MKEYYGSISFSGEVCFSVKAENEEEVKRKIYDEIGMEIKNIAPKENVKISDVQWDFINEAPRGNRETPFIHDIAIYEEK